MPAKSVKQQRFMGAALAMKEGKEPMKGGAGKAAQSMSTKQIKDFAGTKQKGLPAKVKKPSKKGY